MVQSPLATRSVSTSKRSSREGTNITQLIIHHTAGGTNEGNVKLLSENNGYEVSAHYVLQTSGAFVSIVPEEYRAWTTGRSADLRSVTVETVNSSGAPSWAVSDAQLESLSKLAADLSVRYGWGALSRSNVRMHREFMATACPGPYIAARIDRIIARSNEIRGGKTAASAPAGLSWPFAWHTVVRGDTLSAIARKYHMSLSRLRRLNPDITDPTKLQIGARVKVAVDQIPIKLTEDGLLGPETYGRWQQAFGMPVTKAGGRDLVRKIQRRINQVRAEVGAPLIEVTGTFTGETVLAIQHFVNAPGPRDGKTPRPAAWVKKVQKQLNDGTHSWA